ncbi:MAG: hypothetical protein FJW32_05805 [Acidobacteria bacterium]|nr:hypothetical protein [Acidobacteriota bacterium]
MLTTLRPQSSGPRARYAACSLFVLATLLAPPPAPAQNSYGRFTGRVTDQQGAIIAGAKVKITQSETNSNAETITNREGVYDLLNQLPGSYVLTVEFDGFKKHARSGLVLRVGDIVELNIQLELGAVNDSVSITAEAPILETGTASLGQVVDNRMISEMPLSGRGVNYLMQLSPGAVSTNAPMHGWLPQARGSVSDVAVAGTRTRSSEFTLDGIPNMGGDGVIAFQPPPEMIQEFRVQTAAYDASLGRFAGASVNMVLKSGANAYHGTLWGSHLSRPLMTHPFFINSNLHNTATSRPGETFEAKRSRLWPASRTNRYRVQIGGPIRIPKLYDGRNRTFISYGNELMERNFNNQTNTTVPAEEQRRGDFSRLLALGASYQIFDPATVTAVAGGRFQRSPLPGNIIPASRISPIAQRLLPYYPLPNTPGTADFRNNFVTATSATIDYWSHMFRADQVITDRHRFYVSLSTMRTDGDQGRNLNNDANGSITVNRYNSLALDYVWTVSPSTVANLRYGVTRQANSGGPPTLGLDLTTVGLPATFANRLDRALTALPEIDIGGMVTIGTNLPSKGGFNAQFVSATLSQTKGNHTLRYGGEYRVVLDNASNFGNYSGQYSFANAWTRGPLDNSPVAPIGQGMASFLFGLPTSGFVDVQDSSAEKSGYLGVFLQDDWKASRKLTVNLGLRYELEQGITERFNRANRGIDFTTVNPANDAARAAYARNPIPELAPANFNLRGGLLFAGTSGQPRGLWDPDRNNFSPRIGLAYQLNSLTVVRMGYGIFFEPLGADRADATQVGFNQRTNMNPSVDNGQTFRATLANPFPDGFIAAQRSSAGLATNLGLALSSVYPQRRNAYMQRWSFNVQRQLSRNLVVEIGYLGNRGTGLGVLYDFNLTPAQYLSRSPERDVATVNFLSTNIANPFRGISQFGQSPAFFNNQFVSRASLLRPYPHFNGLTMTVNDGFSWYHAGTVRVERRFTKGFSAGGHWTWSKFMEAVERLNGQDLHPHHVVSPQDRPHHFALNGMWELPFGRGRAWMNGNSRWLDAVAGGWSINAIYQWQSGAPVNFGNVIFRGNVRDIVIPYADRTVERWFNTSGFERDPGRQLENNLRTFPLRFTGIRADGWNNWDLSLYKMFSLSERWKLQLRAEAVDALNHAHFGGPNAAPTNTLFGTVNNTIWSEQRKITVAARITF